MSTIYALCAEQCVDLSMKTKVLSDRMRLLRLAREWQQVAAEQNDFLRGRRPMRGTEVQANFKAGYLKGWQSVRGPADAPVNIPESPVVVPSVAFMVGISRGVRDAEPGEQSVW